MIIDFHTHAYPDKIADNGVQYIGDFYALPMYGKGTIAHLKQVEREAGVTYTVVLGVAVRPDLVQSINNWLLSVLDDELIGFGTIHAAYEDNAGEIARFLAEGCRGAKIHPDMQEYVIDDPRLDSAYDYLSQVEAPLMVHLGDARYEYSMPQRLAKVMDRFPRLKVIGAHLGGYTRWDDALTLCGRENLWLDTSSALWALDPALSRNIIERHGEDRILFGTDYPVSLPEREFQLLDRLGLSDSVKEKILYRNGAELLKIPARK